MLFLKALVRPVAHTPPPQTFPVWPSVSLAENRDNHTSLSLVFSSALQMKGPFTYSFIYVQGLLVVAFCLVLSSNSSLSCCSCGLGNER